MRSSFFCDQAPLWTVHTTQYFVLALCVMKKTSRKEGGCTCLLSLFGRTLEDYYYDSTASPPARDIEGAPTHITKVSAAIWI